MWLIKQRHNESLECKREFVEQYKQNKKDKEVAEALEKKQLPKWKEVKMKKSFYLYVWDTIFSVWFNWHDYRFINLSNNKISWLSPGEEKNLWREWEIRVDETDSKASRNHLKLRVDDENNLFLCDNSKHWTFVDEVENSEGKKETMKCEKMTAEEIKEFRNAKKSKEAQYFYEDERYNPNNRVDFWNWNILYTTDRLIRENHKLYWYWIWWYHERIIWYIKIWGEYKLRMFYKSKSEWIRRACPWERNKWGYSKWETIDNYQYETTTKVVPILWDIFDNYGINQCLKSPFEDPIDKSEDLWKLLLEEDLKKEIKVDTLFNSKELMDYLIYRLWTLSLNNKVKENEKSKISNLIKYYQKLEDSNSVLPSTWKIMHDELKWNKEPISFEVTKWIFDKLVPVWLNYSEMYKVEWENYKYNHIDFWEININVYETTRNWKKIKIHFWSVKNNHPEKIWIDNITYSDDEVSSFWIYKNPINAAPLVGKPADYEDQSPSFWDRRMDYKLPSWNMDVRDIYQDNPIIIHYKKLEGLL